MLLVQANAARWVEFMRSMLGILFPALGPLHVRLNPMSHPRLVNLQDLQDLRRPTSTPTVFGSFWLMRLLGLPRGPPPPPPHPAPSGEAGEPRPPPAPGVVKGHRSRCSIKLSPKTHSTELIHLVQSFHLIIPYYACITISVGLVHLQT